jgi:Leucine-rich repeat (LRR) protein
MRNLIPFTAIFLSALLLISGCRGNEPDAAIVRKAIAGMLNKKPDELTTEDYEKTTVFVLSGTKVSDLTPIKELKNLQELYLVKGEVSDLTPRVKGLNGLQGLNLNWTSADLTPIKELKNLRVLYLLNTKVSDVTPIKELKWLNGLDLSGTAVSDLTPLKELNKLQVLWLSGTAVSNEQLAELEKALPKLKIIR